MLAGRTFFKGDEIAKQGAVPTDVVFLTSGAAMVTSEFKEEARLRKLDVMQLCPGRTVETVGLQIVAPEVEPHRWSLVSAEPSTFSTHKNHGHIVVHRSLNGVHSSQPRPRCCALIGALDLN